MTSDDEQLRRQQRGDAKSDWALIAVFSCAVLFVIMFPSLVATEPPEGGAQNLWLYQYPLLQQFSSMPMALCFTFSYVARSITGQRSSAPLTLRCCVLSCITAMWRWCFWETR